jgi:hypothetical protein
MPKYLLKANRRGGRIAQRIVGKMWQFPSLFSEVLRFCLQLLKVKGAVEKIFNA